MATEQQGKSGSHILVGALGDFTLDDNVQCKRLENGHIVLTADFDRALKFAEITKITSVESEKENQLAIRDKNDDPFDGSLIIEGDNLLWDDEQRAEGFYLRMSEMGMEAKMTTQTADPKGKRVVVKNTVLHPNIGDKLVVLLYYRRLVPKGDGTTESALMTKICGELTGVKIELESPPDEP